MQAWCKSIKLLIISALLPGHYPSFIPAIDCGDPGTPTNGQHSLSNTTYNSVVTYTCDVGYGIQGSQNRTCQSNGHWDGSVPQCLCKLAISLHCMHVSVFTGTPSNTALCSSPCQNGGTCIGVDTCTCVTGWTGMLCETGKGVTCKNHIKQFLFVVYPAWKSVQFCVSVFA